LINGVNSEVGCVDVRACLDEQADPFSCRLPISSPQLPASHLIRDRAVFLLAPGDDKPTMSDEESLPGREEDAVRPRLETRRDVSSMRQQQTLFS